MTKDEFLDWLDRKNACAEAWAWVSENASSPRDAWEKCPLWEWLDWLAMRTIGRKPSMRALSLAFEARRNVGYERREQAAVNAYRATIPWSTVAVAMGINPEAD